MQFLNDYKNRGGKVTVGSDSGFIYQTFRFGTILKLLQEACIHSLEEFGPRPCMAWRKRSGTREIQLITASSEPACGRTSSLFKRIR